MKKEISMLFSTPMVQAILNGTKTETRRMFNPQPDENGVTYMPQPPVDWEVIHKEQWKPYFYDTQEGERIATHSKYGEKGDIIWVRECFNFMASAIGKQYYFKASPDLLPKEHNEAIAQEWVKFSDLKWKPSIHMPKDAARIWLQNEGVYIERLHDITNQDAFNEGIEWKIKFPEDHPTTKYYKDYGFKDRFAIGSHFQAMHSFKTLWVSINGTDSWKQNPWVWGVKFKVLSTTGKPKL